MTTQTKFKCNDCGKESDSNAFWAHVQRHTTGPTGITMDVTLSDANSDYCEDCWRKMTAILRRKKIDKSTEEAQDGPTIDDMREANKFLSDVINYLVGQMPRSVVDMAYKDWVISIVYKANK